MRDTDATYDVQLASGDRYKYALDADGNAHIIKCETSATDLLVPAQLEGHPIVEACDESFSRLFTVKRVTLPSGMRAIGAGAFKSCVTLREVVMPDTLRSVGAGAFRATMLQALQIPAACETVDAEAFCLQDSWVTPPSTVRPSTLEKLTVDTDNTALCLQGGVLCMRHDEGLTAIACVREREAVTLNHSIVSVLPAAFTGVTHIGTLRIADRLYATGREVVFPSTTCDLLVVECADGFELPFPMPSEEVARKTLAKLFRARSVDVAQASRAFDEALVQSHDKLQTAQAMLQRLKSERCLEPAAARLFRTRLASALEGVCLNFGASSYWQGFDQLIDVGLLGEQNITHIVDILTRYGDAPAAGYLLQAKRQRFGGRSWEYGI